MERIEIKGKRGVIGWIERHPDGYEVLYSSSRGYLGKYDPQANLTISADGRTWIGNKLMYLIEEDDPDFGTPW